MAFRVRARCLLNPEPAGVRRHLESSRFFWLDLEDATDDQVHRLAELLGLHPLTTEDLQSFHQNPRFEEFGGYVYMVAYGVDPGAKAGSPLLHEVHLVVCGDYVMSVHQRPVAALADLRQRYRDVEMRSEQQLIYLILDALAGTFFPVLARVDDEIDELEDDVIERASEGSLQRIFALKRDLVAMRRVVTPLRDVFARNADRISDLPGMQSDDRQGEVNRQLTIIATIFLPLTLLTGFFGQNFSFLVDHIINHTWSFFVLGLGLMIAAVVGFLLFLRNRDWL